MADYRQGLDLIPPHMRRSMEIWIEQGEPNPKLLGSFLRALLSNDLMGAFAWADMENRVSMFDWTCFLHNYAPIGSYGSPAALDAWYAMHHPAEVST